MPEPRTTPSGLTPLTRMPCAPELGGQQPDLVGLVGLGRAVGDVVRAGDDGVLRHDVDDVAAAAPAPTITRAASRLTRNEPRAITSCWQVPVVGGRLEQRLGDRQPGVVDDEVDAAVGARTPRRTRARDRGLVGDVDLDRRRHVRAAELGGHVSAPATSRSATTTAAPSAASRSAIALPMPDAAAGDERDPAGQRLGRRAGAGSLASSSAQYSMRNFSASAIGA